MKRPCPPPSRAIHRITPQAIMKRESHDSRRSSATPGSTKGNGCGPGHRIPRDSAPPTGRLAPASVRLLKGLAFLGRLEFVDFPPADLPKLHPDLTEGACLAAMQVIPPD